MKKYTGPALTEMRALIALCRDHRTLTPQERGFVAQMHDKATRAVLMLTEAQERWLLSIIDNIVTYNGHHQRH